MCPAGDDEAGEQEVQVDEEDITRREDEQPDAFVTAFWEQTGQPRGAHVHDLPTVWAWNWVGSAVTLRTPLR